MTTTTSSTSSTSTKAAAGSSILTSLGAGSGIDTASLVSSLVNASYADKESQLQTKTDANTAKISSLGTLSNGIDSFASALQQLVAGGTLKSQPSSSDSSVLTATTQSGVNLGSLSAQLEVKQIATAQSVASTAFTGGSTTAVGLGSLNLTNAAGTFAITITSANNTLAGLASAINATNTGTTPSGVTASIITDSSGARLVVKGATGAANAFTLSANSDADANLTRFAFTNPATSGSVMAQAQSAQDAIVRIDGIDTTHSSNTVSDLISGVTLNLVSAKVGSTVSLGITRPTDAITQAVNDYVSAYNSLKGEIDTAVAAGSNGTDAGPLHGNPAINQMKSMLQRITSTALSSFPNGPQTLAEIGVQTGQDGTLSVNAAKLTTALATYPDAVEAMFNPTQRSDNPLIQITSAMGGTKPGTYTIDTAKVSPLSANIGGVAGLPSATDPTSLVASITSTAPGLSIRVLGDVATATITVDAGLSGILQGIRDTLRTTGGLLDTLSDSLSTEKDSLADAKTKLATQESTYSDQLTKQFTAMQTAVANYKSIQAYMTQQIAQWSKTS